MWSTVWLILTFILVLAWLGSQWFVAGTGATRTGFYQAFLTIEQIKGIVISLVVTFIALLMFNSFFPGLSEAYAARGGPEALLLIGVLFICLATFLSPTPMIRKWLVGTLAVIMATAVTFTLVPAIFVGKPQTEVEIRLDQEKKNEAARIRAAQEAKYRADYEAARAEALKPAKTANCPGDVSTTPIRLTTEWHHFTKGCEVAWKAFGPDGRLLTVDEVQFDPPAGIPTKVRLKSGTGNMFTMFCPPGFGSDQAWHCRSPSIPPDVRQASLLDLFR